MDKHSLHQRLLESRVVGPAYLRARPVLRDLWPDARTGIVIDGYPRSANTFAVAAFHLTNPEVVISSHLHSWRAIRRAVELELPTVVVIRPPLRAAASLMVYHPGLHARAALRLYLEFHQRLDDVRESLVISDFARTTGAFGDVIDEVNRRHGTAFTRYDGGEEADAAVTAEVEAMARAHHKRVTENIVSRPSDARQESIGLALEALEREPALVARADHAYERWTS